MKAHIIEVISQRCGSMGIMRDVEYDGWASGQYLKTPR
jgi:hypothetical protein